MNFDWNAPLAAYQRGNPIVETRHCAFPNVELRKVDDEDLAVVFPNQAKHSLKTWGRLPGVKVKDPHWIGVCRQTPLHTDPAYPRYTHQLLLRVDERFALRGHNGEETDLSRGLYLVCDTHSPHQLYARERGALWYIGVSMDAHEVLDFEQIFPVLLDYAQNAEFLTDEVTRPNNGGRFFMTA